jgi:hypothetical protein
MKTASGKYPSPRLLYGLVLTLMVFTLLASIPANATPPAAFTTFDTTKLGCLDGKHPNGIDCNNYAAKEDVYVNGGPGGLGGLSNGSYYFVVLVPGFQNGGFIDGANGNLSDVTPSNDSKSDISEVGAASGDDVSNRTFTVSGGVATYTGTHALGTDPKGDSVIQLFPYDDTTNMGGVYILGICVTGATSPSQCKFDAFRIKITKPCTENCGGQGTTSTVDVCKFWDQNFDHIWDNDEPFIGAWPINATISGGNGATLDAASKDTDNTVGGTPAAPGPGFGCTTFTVTFPNGDGSPDATVTLSEGSAPDPSAIPASQSCNLGAQTCSATPSATWTQSAPWDGTNVLASEQIDVPTNMDVQADNFGNFFGQDLTVSKIATPSFTRTYSWNIVKSLVSPTGNPVEESGSSVTITYSVEATETGFTDTLWAVNGSITVSNPNAFAVSGVNVTDSISDGTNCSITDLAGGANETVPAATNSTTPGTLVVPYTCTYTTQPAYTTLTNTATATWSATTYGTPDGSASGPATFTFNDGTKGNPTKVNSSVTVTDTFNGGSPVTLGTLTATDTKPFTDHTYTVTEKVTITGGTCASFSNTATVTGDNFSITTPPVTVEICNEQTGALTMGFWQNKNGQGIILKYSGTNCQALRTYLNGYDPFSDLAATTCGAVGSTSNTTVIGYIYNVIKAASCTSSSKTCNSMLKAQMLATALDVYFSATGNDPIGAPGPIGGDSIDLTHVCNMIDGSGGTAACSGSYSNVAALFGVAKCATVSAMLSYQNTSDPLPDAGAVWYGQVKASQVGAKNAFDAVNNQVANICP